MSDPRDQRNADNLRRLARAGRRQPPGMVLAHAQGQRFVPALARLAIESYWRAHPLRADRLARALAARSGTPAGWTWRLSDRGSSFRTPPAPFRESAHERGPGTCCICGQPVFHLGWHLDLWSAGGAPNTRARWHACCVAAWKLWNAPHLQRRLIAKLQTRRCAQTGTRLLRQAEVDHRIPLFEVWRDRRDLDWPELLRFWGFPNLQVLNAPAHRAKTIAEAGRRRRPVPTGQQALAASSAAATYSPSALVDSPDWRFSGRGMPTMLNPAST